MTIQQLQIGRSSAGEFKSVHVSTQGPRRVHFVSEHDYAWCDVTGSTSALCKRSAVLEVKRASAALATATPSIICQTLCRTLGSGVAVVLDAAEVIAAAPPFGAGRLFWSETVDGIVLSDSASSLAQALDLPVSLSSLTLQLNQSLPFHPFGYESLWEGVQAVAPHKTLRIPYAGAPTTGSQWVCPDAGSESEALKIVRERLQLVLLANDQGPVSADLSGGVDSSLIAIVASSLGLNPTLFHARPDSEANPDSIWARAIADRIGSNLIECEPLGQTGHSYQLGPYPGKAVLDYPIVWGDTEGYLKTVANHQVAGGIRTHLTGLGGDELFATPGAFAWTLVREEPLRSPIFSLRYALRNRVPIGAALRGLADSTSFSDALRQPPGSQAPGAAAELAWFAAPTLPDWLTDEGRQLHADAIARVVARPLQPLAADHARHQSAESLLFQAHVARQLGSVVADQGMRVLAPFLDPELIDAALSLPIRSRESAGLNKPSLYHAFKGIVPRELFARTDKGEYSSSMYAAFNAAQKTLITELRDGRLVDLGLIDGESLAADLTMPIKTQRRLMSLERLIAVERWLRNNRRGS